MSNKVLIANEQKAVKVPSGLRILIRRACNAVLEYEHFEGAAEISVTFVDKMLGDIVISMERALEQANLYGHSLQREVAFLTVHSMLHLLGYDHENGGLEAVRMREREEAVLQQLGLPRTVSYTE